MSFLYYPHGIMDHILGVCLLLSSIWLCNNYCHFSNTQLFVFHVQDNQGPFISMMMAYIFNAMTHLAVDVRLMAFKFFDLVVQHYPPSFSLYAEKVSHFVLILKYCVSIHFFVIPKFLSQFLFSSKRLCTLWCLNLFSPGSLRLKLGIQAWAWSDQLKQV